MSLAKIFWPASAVGQLFPVRLIKVAPAVLLREIVLVKSRLWH